eukprot:11870-Prymnesium_polylepis.1
MGQKSESERGSTGIAFDWRRTDIFEGTAICRARGCGGKDFSLASSQEREGRGSGSAAAVPRKTGARSMTRSTSWRSARPEPGHNRK